MTARVRPLMALLRRFRVAGAFEPWYLIHHVTRRCPLACHHCFVPTVPFGGDELSLPEIEKIAASVPRLLALNVTGGEPFARSDLAAIVGAWRRHTAVRFVQVTTAGQDPQRIAQFAREVLGDHPGLYLSILVSLDGPAAIHDGVRGREGCHRAAMETLRALRALSMRLPGLDPAVNVTIGTQSAGEVAALYDQLAAELPGTAIAYTLMRDRPEPPNLAAAEALLDSLGRGRHRRRTAAGGLLAAKDLLAREYGLRVARGGCVPGRCNAGRRIGVIWADGSLTACESRTRTFVTLRDFGYDLPRAWGGQVFEGERRAISRTRCCCTHECFWTANILFSAGHLPGLVGAWLKSSTTRPPSR